MHANHSGSFGRAAADRRPCESLSWTDRIVLRLQRLVTPAGAKRPSRPLGFVIWRYACAQRQKAEGAGQRAQDCDRQGGVISTDRLGKRTTENMELCVASIGCRVPRTRGVPVLGSSSNRHSRFVERAWKSTHLARLETRHPRLAAQSSLFFLGLERGTQ